MGLPQSNGSKANLTSNCRQGLCPSRVWPNLNWEIDLSSHVTTAAIPYHHGAWPHIRCIKWQLIQCSFGHDIEGRVIVNEYFGHYVVHALDGHVQILVVSPALNWHLLIGKSQVIVCNDVVDYSLETLHLYVLRYMGLIQDFDQQCPMRLGIHE